MNEILDLIVRHSYLLIFAFVFAEQVGLPLPALPILLAAGALARSEAVDPGLAFVVAVAASVASDLLWYEIGRRRGAQVLRFLCRISLEPDSCVRNTEGLFERWGARSLVVAKFLPGYSTAAPPLAGMFGMRLGRFLVYDLAGALLWIGVFMGAGYAFADEIESLVETVARLSGNLGAAVLGLMALYLGWKVFQRRSFLRELRIARITPEELHRRLAAGEDVIVVDLRHSVEFEAVPESIPGALHLPVEELEVRHEEIPRDREIVLFCT